MDCSIIIVNYNVEYFLFQCLDSVIRATKDLRGEIIVVDNASSDHSIKMIKEHFPTVVLIENKENVGFGIANNQGIQRAKGEFCLLLNPDTIVAEDTISSCIEYLRNNQINTGLGIKMIDGSGQFLPESKRSFPSPAVAFYKLFGLAKLFPTNKRFGKYHLTYLSKDENSEVDVLSGAFLMAKTSVLQEKNGFDEVFFMYGEDIDLSYRLINENEQNHYFADSQIIHYKGESTKTGSLNYVKNFYQAMITFARKHFSGSKAALFIFLINIAIWARGLFTLLISVLKRIGLQIIDFASSIVAMYVVNYFWGIYKFREPFPLESLLVNIPIYAVIFSITMYLSGAYDKPYSFLRLVRGSILGVIFVAVVYAFFPENYRFSRLFILFSGISTGLVYTAIRLVTEYFRSGRLFLYPKDQYRLLFVGNQPDEIAENPLLKRDDVTFLGVLSNCDNQWKVGNLNELKQVAELLNPTDIIFDNKTLSYKYIIEQYEQLNAKIVRHNSLDYEGALLSSQDKSKGGEIYFQNKNYRIQRANQRRNKRMFDIITALSFIFLFPIFIWRKAYRNIFLSQLFLILIGKKTIIGYNNEQLPKLKEHLLPIASKQITNSSVRHQIEKKYASNYDVYQDLRAMFRHF